METNDNGLKVNNRTRLELPVAVWEMNSHPSLNTSHGVINRALEAERNRAKS